jgi:plastocyanin
MEEELPNRKTLTLSLAAIAVLLVPLPASADHPPAAAVASTPPSTTATTPTSTTQTTSTPAITPTATTPTATTPTATTGAPAPRSIDLHVQLAGDPADTISDFQFAPATITVHVGDTITWTNDGPSPHSATAYNGSFDTGTLEKGQSGSHTFTQAGTFTYYCRIHPFMHGTVVVVGSTSSGTPPGTTTTSATTPTTTTAPTTTSASPTTTAAGTSTTGTTNTTSSAPSLPVTGLNLAATALVGLLMLGAGIVIRRRLAAR